MFSDVAFATRYDWRVEMTSRELFVFLMFLLLFWRSQYVRIQVVASICSLLEIVCRKHSSILDCSLVCWAKCFGRWCSFAFELLSSGFDIVSSLVSDQFKAWSVSMSRWDRCAPKRLFALSSVIMRNGYLELLSLSTTQWRVTEGIQCNFSLSTLFKMWIDVILW